MFDCRKPGPVSLLLLALGACSSAASSPPPTNGSSSGGSSTGGSNVGGSSAIGTSSSGGSVSNPSTGAGGASGGSALPGASTGGASTGGASAGGTTSTAGGASSSGGVSAGGASPGTAAGAGGAVSVAACPGVPLMPDSGGFVAPTSNTLGIHGSWFVYSDCPDQKGKPCSMVVSPPAAMFPNVGGKMCTSGTTSTATGAWGAGIALELNDLPPQQPYDTVAHGIKGFCLVLSGTTIPSTGIRVAFPTKNNPDNVYFKPMTTPGPNTVLFADTKQGSWVTTPSAFEPTQVMLLQLQIPSATTMPVPWDFCIEGVTAITN